MITQIGTKDWICNDCVICNKISTHGIVVHPTTGDIYVSLMQNHTIRKISKGILLLIYMFCIYIN